MKNINNTFNKFPANSEEYFENKPEGLTNHQWLFDPTNPYYFCFWVSVLINKIHILSLMRGWTFFKLVNLPARLPQSISKCIDTLSITLNRLVTIGVLEMRVIKKNKQYRVNWAFLRTANIATVNKSTFDMVPTMIRTIFDENIVESPFDTINYEDEILPSKEECNINNMVVDHQGDDLNLSDPILSESDKENDQPSSNLIKLDAVEIEIKQKFETITGKTLNLKKNRKPLAELAQMAKEAKDIVLLAFSNVANYINETGNKVYNLAYVLTAAKNLMKPKIKPNTAKDYAHACVGGDIAKYREAVVVETAEQKAQRLERESKFIEQELKHDQLRKELFEALSQQDKDELIEMELDYLKSQPVWEKLKPCWPWFDPRCAINHAVDRIKQYLLQEHLEYQAFLITQPSS